MEIFDQVEWKKWKQQINKYYEFALTKVMRPLQEKIEAWTSSNMCQSCQKEYIFWIETPKIQLD